MRQSQIEPIPLLESYAETSLVFSLTWSFREQTVHRPVSSFCQLSFCLVVEFHERGFRIIQTGGEKPTRRCYSNY